MICKRCKTEMKYIGGLQNGGYYICNKCNNVLIMGDSYNDKENNKQN